MWSPVGWIRPGQTFLQALARENPEAVLWALQSQNRLHGWVSLQTALPGGEAHVALNSMRLLGEMRAVLQVLLLTLYPKEAEDSCAGEAWGPKTAVWLTWPL